MPSPASIWGEYSHCPTALMSATRHCTRTSETMCDSCGFSVSRAAPGGPEAHACQPFYLYQMETPPATALSRDNLPFCCRKEEKASLRPRNVALLRAGAGRLGGPKKGYRTVLQPPWQRGVACGPLLSGRAAASGTGDSALRPTANPTILTAMLRLLPREV